jgi:hypothetical protein
MAWCIKIGHDRFPSHSSQFIIRSCVTPETKKRRYITQISHRHNKVRTVNFSFILSVRIFKEIIIIRVHVELELKLQS